MSSEKRQPGERRQKKPPGYAGRERHTLYAYRELCMMLLGGEQGVECRGGSYVAHLYGGGRHSGGVVVLEPLQAVTWAEDAVSRLRASPSASYRALGEAIVAAQLAAVAASRPVVRDDRGIVG